MENFNFGSNYFFQFMIDRSTGLFFRKIDDISKKWIYYTYVCEGRENFQLLLINSNIKKESENFFKR